MITHKHILAHADYKINLKKPKALFLLGEHMKSAICWSKNGTAYTQ